MILCSSVCPLLGEQPSQRLSVQQGSSGVEIGENCRQIAEPLEELFDRTGASSNEELQPWSDCPLMTLSHLSAFAPVQGQSIVFTDGEESEAAASDSTTAESSPGSG